MSNLSSANRKSDLLHGQPLFYALEKNSYLKKNISLLLTLCLAFIYYYFPISGTYSKEKKSEKKTFFWT
jgi:hypothetical protein